MKRLLLVAICACSQNDEPPRQELTAPQANLMGAVASGVYEAPPKAGPSHPAAAPDPQAARKLFADGVDIGTLPLSISIETLGDVSTAIIPRGTSLPVSHTEVFSTAQDDQDRVEVHVLMGERPLATQNRSLGRFQLFGIPPAPRGVPQIEVTFLIDAQGVLTVSARDKATGRRNAVRIDGAAGTALDQATIDQLLAESRAGLKTDLVARDWARAKNDLEQLIYTSRSLMSASRAKLSKKTRAKVEQEIAAADAMLKLSTTPDNPALLRAVDGSLRRAVHTATKELYAP